ncbi:glycosyltransferase [Anderseniella sp. Alg231-50]|uniref:glycosyltransferase n=1 Tax=Anderseniella sp. Alg231-50 TaxID=1922226 RepID=UPI000D55138A
MTQPVAFVLKGYPRLSETFIAQEILGLERAGLPLEIISLRRPTDGKRHPVHGEIKAPVMYLPEYVKDEPLRCFRAWLKVRRLAGYRAAFKAFRRDWARDRTSNRARRFVQAMVLAAERQDAVSSLHAHFIHTPASVVRYASMILQLGWTCSAHAKDIWTSDDWDLADKLAEADWAVTCTRNGCTTLRSLAADPSRVHLSYHGLDLSRFSVFDKRVHVRDGRDEASPVRFVSVGRAVTKKGYDTLLDALAKLPQDIHWRFDHAGGGDLLDDLRQQAGRLGVADRITWHGAMAQEDVLKLYRDCDVFVLPCRIAPDGDRDGLPNVLVEAASQGLACVSTDVSGVPELIDDGTHGLLVRADDPMALASALTKATREPALRARLGAAAEGKVRGQFDHQASVRQLMDLFSQRDTGPRR